MILLLLPTLLPALAWAWQAALRGADAARRRYDTWQQARRAGLDDETGRGRCDA